MRAQVEIKAKTPKKVNAAVKGLISKLGLNHKSAKYLGYTESSDDYRATYCFNNCEKEQKKTDCEIVFGWQIWEDRKNKFVEAEFHSVIRDADGQLKDISPRQTGDKQILFIPDSTRESGRIDSDTWASWSNLKMQDGHVLEESIPLEVREINETYSEVRRRDT